MKTTKKAISILLTILMVVGMMSTFAFAEGNGTNSTYDEVGSITVANPQDGRTYTAYKIFDVTYGGSETIGEGKDAVTTKPVNYSYTISTGSDWFTTVKKFVEDTENNWISLVDTGDGGTFAVKLTNATASDVAGLAAELAAELAKDDSKLTGTELVLQTNDSGKWVAKAESLSLGFYFISTTSGSLAMMTTTDKDVIIYDKNESDGFDKSATKINGVEVLSTNSKAVDANIGDVITFEITVKVPSTQGYASQTYTVKDIMSTGLTYNQDLSIAFKDVEAAEENAAKTALEEAVSNQPGVHSEQGLAFKKLVDMTKLQKYIGKTIVFTYTATVNENALDKNTNTAGLVKNTPSGETTPGEISEVIVYTGGIEVVKVDGATLDKDAKVVTTTKKLKGAKFILKKKVKDDDNADVIKYYKQTVSNDKVTKVEWVDEKASATVLTTDANGGAVFSGIAPGTYFLEETQAPDGYNPLKGDKEVNVKEGTSTDVLTLTPVNVANITGTELPETGGIGTTVFYLLGAILVVGAGVVFVTRRRMHAEK